MINNNNEIININKLNEIKLLEITKELNMQNLNLKEEVKFLKEDNL